MKRKIKSLIALLFVYLLIVFIQMVEAVNWKWYCLTSIAFTPLVIVSVKVFLYLYYGGKENGQ